MALRLRLRSSGSRAAVSLLTLAALALGGEAHAQPKLRTYTVQPGDTLWSIAEELYGSGARYRLIYRHNRFVGRPPHILRPGQVLTVPEGQVTPEAELSWTHDAVRAKPPRSLDWLRAGAGMNLWKRYELETGAGAGAELGFEDGSRIGLGGDTRVAIDSGARKPKTRRARATRTELRLIHGTLRAAHDDADARDAREAVRIETAHGNLEIDGGRFEVSADDERVTVSVYAGKVKAQAGGETRELGAGEGLTIARGEGIGPSGALLQGPSWTLIDDGGVVAVVPEGGTTELALSWGPVEGARAYRVELAHDERFERVVRAVEVAGGMTRTVIDQVPIGRFTVRVRAIDARRVHGHASATLGLEVLGLETSRRMTRGDRGRWEVVGLARLSLGERGAGLEWALDGGAFVPGEEPLRAIGAGVHVVDVRRGGHLQATRLSFAILGVRGALELGGKARLRAGEDDRREVALTVVDERGRPASVPGVTLVLEPGGELALAAAGPGRWTGVVPAPEAPGPQRIAVRAVWPDGVLAAGMIDVERKLLEPYLYRWRETTQTASWRGPKAATELPGPWAIDRVGSELDVAQRANATTVGWTLRGELALVDERLGLDAALGAFRVPLHEDRQGHNELGELVLGARYVAHRDRRLALAPSLRARVALGPDEGVPLGLEPSALLRFRALETLWIDTRQGIFGALGRDGEASYIGDYALLWLPLGVVGPLGLTAQLDTAVSFTDAPFASAVGLGVQLLVARVRLGLELGAGLGEGGRTRFGELHVGLSIDFGLGTP